LEEGLCLAISYVWGARLRVDHINPPSALLERAEENGEFGNGITGGKAGKEEEMMKEEGKVVTDIGGVQR
jgi:hypothetical protein